MQNSIHTEVTFEHWKKMDPNERDFHLFRSLQSMQGDIKALKQRKKWDTVFSGFMGFVGGASAVFGKMAIWK